MYNICTVADFNYLAKAVTLYLTLEKYCNDFRLWFYCEDAEAKKFLSKLNLKNAVIYTFQEINDQEFMRTKNTRSKIEFAMTAKSACMLHAIQKLEKDEKIIYMDADMGFLGDPSVIFNEMGDYSIYLCTQRTNINYETNDGIYNSGMVGFRKDAEGVKCLIHWREQCIEWCSTEHEPNRWTDQKYLNKWPSMYKNLFISYHKGINTGPWAVFLKEYKPSSSIRNGQIYMEEYPLIAYHYSGLYHLGGFRFDCCSYNKFNKIDIQNIYFPYIDTFKRAVAMLNAVGADFTTKLGIRGVGRILNPYPDMQRNNMMGKSVNGLMNERAQNMITIKADSNQKQKVQNIAKIKADIVERNTSILIIKAK